MPWGKMDDKFHRNAKVRATRKAKGGREALGVWAFWWSWCLDDPELTGIVPEDELPPVDRRAAALLVEVGLWDVVEGGYRFHDFEQYNPSRVDVEAKREADRKRVAEKRAASRTNVARDIPATHVATKHGVASTRDPNPSQPNPTQPDSIPQTPFGDADAWDSAFGPDQREPPSATTGWPIVARGYQARWEAATKTVWAQFGANREPLEQVWRWCASQAGRDGVTPDSVVATVLDRYFGDAWAASRSFPLPHLARNPAKYFAAPVAPPRGQDEERAVLEFELREAEEKRSAIYRAGKFDEAKQLDDSIAELAVRLNRLGPARPKYARGA